MHKIVIHDEEAERIFDVSSPDPKVANAASAAIHKAFDEAARQAGELIRRRYENKKRKALRV